MVSRGLLSKWGKRKTIWRIKAYANPISQVEMDEVILTNHMVLKTISSDTLPDAPKIVATML